MRCVLLALAASTALAGGAGALEYPQPGPLDPNMRTATYNPQQRYLIVGSINRQTTITFGKTEVVGRVALGDESAWETQKAAKGRDDGPDVQVRAPKNSLTMWPLKPLLTNLQVTTDLPDGTERVYEFSLVARDPASVARGGECPDAIRMAIGCEAVRAEDPNAIYGLTFLYPAEARAAAAAEARAQLLEDNTRRATDRVRVDGFYGYRNWQYLARGDRTIAPTEVSDNRRLTGFRYPGTLAIPAIFWLGPDGGERSLSYDMLDDVAMVRVRARVFRLRQGDTVVEVYNCDDLAEDICAAASGDPAAFARLPFRDPGPDPRTGTTSPDVLRDVRANK